MYHSHLQARRAFTLIELLVVISIIGLLAGMIYPIVIAILGKGNQVVDTNNMKQIMQMYQSDRMSTRQTWAFAKGNSNFSLPQLQQPQINGGDCDSSGTDVTNISFYTLAARADLSPDVFNSPDNPCIQHIANVGRQAEKDWTTEAIADWASPQTGSITDTNIPYALDWSAPKSAGTARIVLGMRNPLLYKEVPVIYADGHAGNLQFDPTNNAVINTAVTPMNETGKPKAGGTLDDIYTPAGDIPGGGTGSPRHLYMGMGDPLRTDLK